MEHWSKLARDIFEQKYAHTKRNGKKESWTDASKRVVDNVVGAAPALAAEAKNQILQAHVDRKIITGGRYLAAAGRDFHQVQNCFMLRAEDTSAGWADLMHKTTAALMSGGGIGSEYSDLRPRGAKLKTKGGVSSGPLALIHMVNEAGRHIRQGGERRSAIWAGLRWSHDDIFDFIEAKSWSEAQRKAKEDDPDFPLPLEGTNISVILDQAFFDAYNQGDAWAVAVYREAVKGMLQSGEPGFSIDYANPRESLRNAPVTADTRVLTPTGYVPVGCLVDKPVTVWTGTQWATDVVFKQTAADAALVRVTLTNGRSITCDPTHPFMVRRYKGSKAARRVILERVAAADLAEDDKIQSDLPQLAVEPGAPRDYGYGFALGDGSVQNGCGDISIHDEAKRQAYERAVRVLEAHSVATPDRAYFRCAVETKDEWLQEPLSPNFIAGWFDADGCWTRGLLRISSTEPQRLHKLQESLDLLGIKSVVRPDGVGAYRGTQCYTLGVLASSLLRFQAIIPTERVCIDLDPEYVPYRESEIRVSSVEVLDWRAPVYCADVRVPEHSFMAEGVVISNCTEAVSEDDSDVCNLGSVNMARVKDYDDFVQAVRACTVLLLAGTLYSHVPYPKVAEVRDRNRRLGVGLMGIHEWLITRGLPYGEHPELSRWLDAYRTVSAETAESTARAWGIPVPVACRAIAPTGSIAIIGETTSGIEPVYSVAYKRRYYNADGKLSYQYVVDPTAKRLIESGVEPGTIEDAYTLAADPERRVAFQAYVQGYVDQAIASTVNLPAYGSEHNPRGGESKFGAMLYKYLPKLRGITCYPDGSRGRQPLTPVKYETAMRHVGEVFVESTDVCDLTSGGSCGS